MPIATTVTVIGISILAAPWTLRGQAHRETIPFVGCPQQGQSGYVKAPEGQSQSIDLDSVTARQIAYYKGDNGPGVFAPRGWHCRGWEGSAGGTLVVTPGPIDSLGARPRLLGRAVELEGWEGGTSGRFAVATYSSRLFTRVAAKFIERVKGEGLTPRRDFELGPYVNDSVRYPSALVAAFTTPGSRTGFGTEGSLVQSRDPIRGIAVLDTLGDWALSILRVRLGPSMGQVEMVVLKLNQQCMASHSCSPSAR